MVEITERNTGMFRRAKRTKAAGMDKDQAVQSLTAWNSCMPDPLTDEELTALIDEVYDDKT